MILPTLQCQCQCGCVVSPTLLVLTPLKQLSCLSLCPNCGAKVQTNFPLLGLLKSCPRPELPTKQLAQAIDEAIEEATGKDPYELTEADIIRLHGMMIEGAL